MATKLYLHNVTNSLTGTFPTSEQSASTAVTTWTNANTLRTMDTTIGTSMVTVTNATAAATSQTHFIGMFCSRPLSSNQTVGGGTMVFNCADSESNAQANYIVNGLNVYVWTPGNGTKRGTVKDTTTGLGGTEATSINSIQVTHLSGITSSGVSAIAGDVVICEVWATFTQANSTSRTVGFYYDGTTENTTENAVVTNHASYLQLTENLTFGTTYTETPSGGATGGGVADRSVITSRSVSGGAVSGSTVVSQLITNTSGGILGGGIAQPNVTYAITVSGGSLGGSTATVAVNYTPNSGGGITNSLIGDAVFAGLAGTPQTAYQDTVGTADGTFTGTPTFSYDSILKRDVFNTSAGSYAKSATNNAPAVGLSALTFAIWMKVSGSFRSFAAPISCRDDFSVSSLSFYTESDGRTSLWLRMSSNDVPCGGQYGGGSAISQPASDWKLWIATWTSGSYVTLYAADPDGAVTFAAQSAATQLSPNGNDVQVSSTTVSIGQDNLSPGSSEFYGSTADIVIFNRVLNSTEMGWLADTNYRITGYVSSGSVAGAVAGGSASVGKSFTETPTGGFVANPLN